jgi:hypothetical protein
VEQIRQSLSSCNLQVHWKIVPLLLLRRCFQPTVTLASGKTMPIYHCNFRWLRRISPAFASWKSTFIASEGHVCKVNTRNKDVFCRQTSTSEKGAQLWQQCGFGATSKCWLPNCHQQNADITFKMYPN